jgi:hypothetical protein
MADAGVKHEEPTEHDIMRAAFAKSATQVTLHSATDVEAHFGRPNVGGVAHLYQLRYYDTAGCVGMLGKNERSPQRTVVNDPYVA